DAGCPEHLTHCVSPARPAFPLLSSVTSAEFFSAFSQRSLRLCASFSCLLFSTFHFLFSRLPSQQIPRNNHALHFTRPLINRNHSRISVHPLHFRLPRIPLTPMNLHRLCHHAVHHLAGIQLRPRRPGPHPPAHTLQMPPLVPPPPSRFNPRLHARQHPLNRLKLADRLSKRLPRLREFHRLFQRPLSQSHRLRRNSNPSAIQRAQS